MYVGKKKVTPILSKSRTDRLQWKCNNMQSLEDEFYQCASTEIDDILKGLDVSNIKNFKKCFYESKITEFPNFVSSNITNASGMCSSCKSLITADVYGLTGESIIADQMFYNCTKVKTIRFNSNFKPNTVSMSFFSCYKLETIDNLDIINAITASLFIDGCSELKNLTLKNIKVDIPMHYSPKLTDESLINTAKEFWDFTGSTSKTLKVSATNNARFDAIYVKLITATDEMIAEDEYINNKKPCEVCESTDEGAMTLREYVVSKNWALAKA